MAGTYTVTVNLNGCVGTMTTNVIVNSTPTVTATNTGPYCPGQTISLATSTGGTYSQSGPNAFASTTQNPTLSGATTAMGGAYTVTLTANSCTASASTIVVVNSNNSITLSSAPGTDNQAVCVGSAITSITYATSGAKIGRAHV